MDNNIKQFVLEHKQQLLHPDEKFVAKLKTMDREILFTCVWYMMFSVETYGGRHHQVCVQEEQQHIYELLDYIVKNHNEHVSTWRVSDAIRENYDQWFDSKMASKEKNHWLLPLSLLDAALGLPICEFHDRDDFSDKWVALARPVYDRVMLIIDKFDAMKSSVWSTPILYIIRMGYHNLFESLMERYTKEEIARAIARSEDPNYEFAFYKQDGDSYFGDAGLSHIESYKGTGALEGLFKEYCETREFIGVMHLDHIVSTKMMKKIEDVLGAEPRPYHSYRD